MAGMLTVVNPRRRRRSKARRVKSRRRRRTVHHAAANPVRRRRRRSVHARRRVHARRARRSNPRRHRRRRHANPFGGMRMGGIMGTLTKGLALGGGAIATNLATNAANYLIGGGAAGTGKKLDGAAKIALKAAVGLVGLPMLIGFIPGAKKYVGQVRLGAGIAVAFDVYDQFIKAKLPVYLQDYQYGSLSDWAPLGNYERGQLSDWAPQSAMSGAGAYDQGIYE